jgi:hypothetical protein
VLNLSAERWDPVIRWARHAYPDQPLAYGIRELLLIGSGIDPTDATLVAARQAAYNNMLGRLRNKVLSAIGPFADQLNAEEARAVIEAENGKAQ